MSSTIQDIPTTIQDNIKKAMKNTSLEYLPYILISLIVMLFLIYIVNKITLNKSNCLTLKNLYTSTPNIKNIDFENNDYSHQLRDYYVKSSYNSCCSGHFKNDYVSICALENVLKNGARFLDFEIYAKDEKPIIAASSSAEYKYKETYNHVEFEEAMKKIRDIAFADITPNHNDPLILNFRIKTNSIKVHNIMAKDIYYSFNRNFLNTNFNFENKGNNLGEVSLNKLKRTILISVDKSNPTYKSTKLYSFVNISSGSPFLRTYRNYDIEYATNLEEITNFNKGNMAIVLPDYNDSNDNKSYMYAKEAGVQFIAMNFQKFDAAFKMYSLLFDSAGSAFILKPDHLRFHNITLKDPVETNSLPDGTADYNCKGLDRGYVNDDNYQSSGIDFSTEYVNAEINYDITNPYVQYAVKYVDNCDKKNGFIDEVLSIEEMETAGVKPNKPNTFRNSTPDISFFDNYNISKEVNGPFPHTTQQNRFNHWNTEGKNWGDWYCQQFQDEKGKCVLSDIKRGKNITNKDNKGKIVCKSQGSEYWKKNKKNYWNKSSIIKGKGKTVANNYYNDIYDNINNNRSWGENFYDNTSKGLIEWVGNKMRFDESKDLYEVKKCDQYSGILGLNNYDIKEDKEGIWRNLYIGKNSNDDFQIKTYNNADFLNTNSQIRNYAEEYCKKAVYGYDEYNNPKKCTFSHANTDSGEKKLGKVFNITFLKDGRHELYKKRKKNKKKKHVPYITKNGINETPFWMIHCKEP